MAIKGPALWDRLLMMSLASTKIILIVILFASLQETEFLLDYAIIYALSGFIGMIFIALLGGAQQRKKRGRK
jgi:multicomponent Na+:H+ antiporter subunit F